MCKVTIIMATYNRAHFIVETLQSIQKQTYEDWECLIIDDGGTDDTYEVITPILEADARFQFLKRPDRYLKGLPGSRNYGLDIAQGEYVIFFDDDDIIHPENLKISLAAIKNEKVDFCHYQKQSFENEKPVFEFLPAKIIKSISVINIEDIVKQQIGFASCTVLWNKRCFENIRFYEELLYAEEWECYSRIITNGFKGVEIDSVLYINRKHPNSNTGEFYKGNAIRRASKKDAILLVLKNLKEKKMLSKPILHYFVQISLQYKEYDLFKAVLQLANLKFFENLKWQLFYKILPFRLYIYRAKKKIVS